MAHSICSKKLHGPIESLHREKTAVIHSKIKDIATRHQNVETDENHDSLAVTAPNSNELYARVIRIHYELKRIGCEKQVSLVSF